MNKRDQKIQSKREQAIQAMVEKQEAAKKKRDKEFENIQSIQKKVDKAN